MKITKLKISYINGDVDEIQIGKKWVVWGISDRVLLLEGIGKLTPPQKVSKYIPLSSILFFIVEETDGK